jgi:hypothetical protein
MSQDNAIGIKEYEQAIAALKHSVPADIISPYKPSGKYVKSSLWKIIAFGVPITIVIIFFSYVVMGLLFKLAAWIVSGGTSGDRLLYFMSRAFRGMVYFFYLLLLPIFTGMGIGGVTGILGRKLLCRNVKIIRTNSAINSILGYILFYIIFLKLIDSFLHGPSFAQMPLGLSVMMFGIFSLHAIIGTISATITGGVVIVGNPYCEECEKYYENIQTKRVSIELTEPIIETLKKGELQDFVVTNADKTSRVWFESSISKCPLCNKADYKIKIVLAYMKGLTDCKRDTWLETMIPSSLGVKINEAISKTSEQK